jgi:acyl carrier protein phosphodiesterase
MKILLMKDVVATVFMLFNVCTCFAQQDTVSRYERQLAIIDSLKNVIATSKIISVQLEDKHKQNYKNLQDSVQSLTVNLSKLKKFRAQEKAITLQLTQKSDSINLLKATVYEKHKQSLQEMQKNRKIVVEEKERGKKEIIDIVLNNYKTNSFDALLKSYSKQSVNRDMQLSGNTEELKILLQDLNKYLDARELLKEKFDDIQIKNIQKNLNKIERASVLLDELKELVDKYQTVNEGFKETVRKIMALDKLEKVMGMPEEVQINKRSKILSEISLYIFNYDFKFDDYPYLGEIMLAIIKQKQPNPDEDIMNLSLKL